MGPLARLLARSRPACALLAGALLLGACACEPRPTSLNPLFSADPTTGAYEVDPFASLPQRAPAPGRGGAPADEPAAAEPAVCKHLYGPYATHSYRDPLTGLPALCAIVRCSKCGDLRHECERGPRR